MNPLIRGITFITDQFDRIYRHVGKEEVDPYNAAKYLLNIRLSFVFLVAGLLYSITFISIGHTEIFLFAVGISLCLLLVPFTLKRGFNSTTRGVLFYVTCLIFVSANIFGSGNEVSSIVILWILLTIQLAIAILQFKAAQVFTVIVVALFVLKMVMSDMGFQFYYFIPKEIATTPRLIDVLTPLFYNLFMFYNSISLNQKAQNEMMETRAQVLSMNKKIAESEYRYRVIVEQSLGYISIHDERGILLFANHASAKALGYQPHELHGKNLASVLDRSVTDNFDVYLRTVLGKGVAEGIMKVRSKDGGVHYWFYKNVRLNNEGRGAEVIGFAHDITELENTRQQLVKARQKAEESDKLKSIFLANMSHEIRTPMNAIIGFSELLEKQQYNDEKRREFTWHIRERSKDLLHIINNILDFSRLEAGNVSIVAVEGDVDEMMNRIVGSIDAEINYLKRRQISVKKVNKLSVGQNRVILDFLRLNQVLSNLMSNALKFTQKGEIKLSCKLIKEGMLEFSVSDTGEGIDPSKLDLIFKPFRQADDSIHRRHGGSGLGLAICKGLVDMWGGSISVETQYASGSKFTVTVPFEKAGD